MQKRTYPMYLDIIRLSLIHHLQLIDSISKTVL